MSSKYFLIALLPVFALAACTKSNEESRQAQHPPQAQVAVAAESADATGKRAKEYEPDDYGDDVTDESSAASSTEQTVSDTAVSNSGGDTVPEAIESNDTQAAKQPQRVLPAGISQSAKLVVGPSCDIGLKRPAVRGVCVGDVDLEKLNQFCAISSLVTIKNKPKNITYNTQEPGHERALLPVDMPNAAGTVLVKEAEYECPGYGTVTIQSAYNDDKSKFDYQVIGAESVVCVPDGVTMEPGSPLFRRLEKEYGTTDLFEPNRVYEVESKTSQVQVRYPQLNGGSPAPCSEGQMPLAVSLKAQPQSVTAEVNYVLSKYEEIQNDKSKSTIDTMSF